MRKGFATVSYSGEVEKAALQVFTSANSLKNAMGALVAFAGNPGAATLAHFTSQYTPAKEEWDAGVSTIWRLAHEPNAPPTLEPKSSSTGSSTRPTSTTPSALNNPAQRAVPGVTALCDEVPAGHACNPKLGGDHNADPNSSPQRNCTPSIVANANTSCRFAENAFYDDYEAHVAGEKETSLMVYSPTTKQTYDLFCAPQGALVMCESSPSSVGIYVSFPRAAIDTYTQAQAQAYAGSHDVRPG